MEHISKDTEQLLLATMPHVEIEVQDVLEQMAEAIRHGDLERIMSFYAPHFVAFDMMPPLAFISKEDYKKKAWQECFTDVFEFPVQYDFQDLKIHFSGDLAICHSFCHVVVTFKNGSQKIDNWIRNTIALKCIEDQWLIVHEHNSVPVGFDGKALMDLNPGEGLH